MKSISLNMLDQQDPAVFVVGHNNLQNAVLIDYVKQNYTGGCRLIEKLRPLTPSSPEAQPPLLMIDTKSISHLDIVNFIAHINRQQSTLQVALYNCSRPSLFDELIQYPNIKGIFYDDTPHQLVVKGIKCIFSGEYWFPRNLLTQFLEQHRTQPMQAAFNIDILTKRELEILRLTATGATNNQIADSLNVSMHTVKTHMYNLFKKLKVTNRMQAVNWVKQNQQHLLNNSNEAIMY